MQVALSPKEGAWDGVLRKMCLKIDRQALVVHAVYKSRMTWFPMQGNIATRDRIHKSDVDSSLQMVDDL